MCVMCEETYTYTVYWRFIARSKVDRVATSDRERECEQQLAALWIGRVRSYNNMAFGLCEQLNTGEMIVGTFGSRFVYSHHTFRRAISRSLGYVI